MGKKLFINFIFLPFMFVNSMQEENYSIENVPKALIDVAKMSIFIARDFESALETIRQNMKKAHLEKFFNEDKAFTEKLIYMLLIKFPNIIYHREFNFYDFRENDAIYIAVKLKTPASIKFIITLSKKYNLLINH